MKGSGDGVGGPPVLQLPDVGGQPGARLVLVPAVAHVAADPVPDGAVGQPCVGLLLTGAEVSDLSAVHHPLCHAVV